MDLTQIFDMIFTWLQSFGQWLMEFLEEIFTFFFV
jgi:hypothetical protein